MTDSSRCDILPALGLCVALVLLLAPGAQAKVADCSHASGEPVTPGKPLDETITLTPDRASETLNFASSRGTKDRDVVVKADKRLPDSVTADQIAVTLPRRYERASDNDETAYLDRATYTTPVIDNRRREITFTVCVNADEAKAGTYVSSLRVSGPEGTEPAAVPFTVNVRARYLVFVLCMLAALALAIGLLMYRRRKDADATVDRDFWLQSAIPLGAAAVAMITVFATDPAWGARATTFFALAGTALSAAGLKSLLDAGAGRAS